MRLLAEVRQADRMSAQESVPRVAAARIHTGEPLAEAESEVADGYVCAESA